MNNVVSHFRSPMRRNARYKYFKQSEPVLVFLWGGVLPRHPLLSCKLLNKDLNKSWQRPTFPPPCCYCPKGNIFVQTCIFIEQYLGMMWYLRHPDQQKFHRSQKVSQGFSRMFSGNAVVRFIRTDCKKNPNPTMFSCFQSNSKTGIWRFAPQQQLC